MLSYVNPIRRVDPDEIRETFFTKYLVLIIVLFLTTLLPISIQAILLCI